eukprot:1186377-Prorocentrum_minimum.AAC.6
MRIYPRFLRLIGPRVLVPPGGAAVAGAARARRQGGAGRAAVRHQGLRRAERLRRAHAGGGDRPREGRRAGGRPGVGGQPGAPAGGQVSLRYTLTTLPIIRTSESPVAESTPPVAESTPPVAESTPPVAESTPPVAESTPPVAESTPPVVQAGGAAGGARGAERGGAAETPSLEALLAEHAAQSGEVQRARAAAVISSERERSAFEAEQSTKASYGAAIAKTATLEAEAQAGRTARERLKKAEEELQ